MMRTVHYTHLLPHEFRTQLATCPVAYLPLGTLEWHGEHMALGTDALIAEGVFVHTAQQFGGIVMPPLFLGPDRIRPSADGYLVGMEYAESTTPARQLDGGCYWIPEGLFILLLEQIVAQVARAGFRVLVADGHGPSRRVWGQHAPQWQVQYGIRLVSVTHDIPHGWQSQIDHAAQNETSLMQALHPQLVDLTQLADDRTVYPQGVGGVDPRDATASHGAACLDQSVALLIACLQQAFH
jgi:creatinine amidohydrolase